MTQEGSEASVASSSPAANWWPEMNTNSMAAPWNVLATHRWQQQPQPQFSTNVNPSNSTGEEDISMATNSFTHNSGLGITSSPSSSSAATAVIDPGENHLWNQVFLGVGSNGEGEKFLEVLSSKSLTTHMFDPACDYLKKLDSSWELTSSSSSLDTLERQLKTYTAGHMIDSERVTSNLTDLLSHWSIAPPNPHIDQAHIAPSTCNVSMSPNPMPYFSPHIKHELAEGSTFSLGGLTNGDQVMSDAPWAAPRTTPDLNSYVSTRKPSSLRSQGWFESSKRGGQYETSPFTKGSGRGSGTAYEGKKKRTEDSSEAVLKKFKHESPSASPANKMQAPKVKVSEKITALQQIVSPFGRTDTASVLLEAINYISYLQEQIQLLSDPYLKSSANKDHNSWHGLERKEKAENKSDLRSRGLCLVPISCTPQIYRENTGPDYWTPPYRGCLYR